MRSSLGLRRSISRDLPRDYGVGDDDGDELPFVFEPSTEQREHRISLSDALGATRVGTCLWSSLFMSHYTSRGVHY